MKSTHYVGVQKPSKIMENLYLGSADQSDNLAVLKTLGIKYILVAGNNLVCNFPDVNYYLKNLEFHLQTDSYK